MQCSPPLCSVGVLIVCTVRAELESSHPALPPALPGRCLSHHRSQLLFFLCASAPRILHAELGNPLQGVQTLYVCIHDFSREESLGCHLVRGICSSLGSETAHWLTPGAVLSICLPASPVPRAARPPPWGSCPRATLRSATSMVQTSCLPGAESPLGPDGARAWGLLPGHPPPPPCHFLA